MKRPLRIMYVRCFLIYILHKGIINAQKLANYIINYLITLNVEIIKNFENSENYQYILYIIALHKSLFFKFFFLSSFDIRIWRKYRRNNTCSILFISIIFKAYISQIRVLYD